MKTRQFRCICQVYNRLIFSGLFIVTTSHPIFAQTIGPIVPLVGRTSAGFFDPIYSRQQDRQHLGVDISGKAGSTVFSPLDGVVITNLTGAKDVMQAYLVIRGVNGEDHVLGHISSSLKVGSNVKSGEKVGKVREWPNNSHLHWGINKKGVSSAMSGDWGWGRAPVKATRSQAEKKGWVAF